MGRSEFTYRGAVRIVRSEDISAAAAAVADGGVVAFPTETVYGLGANALDATAAARIFAIKRRPHFDPLIVHVGGAEDVASVASFMSTSGTKLAEAFWPGPLTLILPKHERVPGIVTSGLATVAVRVP